jgi:hypothetical protein
LARCITSCDTLVLCNTGLAHRCPATEVTKFLDLFRDDCTTDKCRAMAVHALEILDLHATGKTSIAVLTLTVTSDAITFTVTTNQAAMATTFPLTRCTHDPLLVAFTDSLV